MFLSYIQGSFTGLFQYIQGSFALHYSYKQKSPVYTEIEKSPAYMEIVFKEPYIYGNGPKRALNI